MSSNVLTANQKRAAHPDFVPTFSSAALKDRLPLSFPVPDDLPPSPKRQYRSFYRYLGADDLDDLSSVQTLSQFEIALRLIDFSPLRDLFAQYYVQSAKGQVPFDPVSLFLCLCLRRDQKKSWRQVATLLRGKHGKQWRRRFGFADNDTPSASGLRHFRDRIGAETFEELCCLFVDLLRQAGLLPHGSTFPGDPPGRGLTISHDLMLHEARCNMRCAQVSNDCYQPAPRSCAAKEAGKEGCDCHDLACRDLCQRSTPLDAEARYLYYQGRNKSADLPQQQSSRGRHVYGYLSNPDRLVDDRFACAWTLRTGLHPANRDERSLFPESFAQLRERFPWLRIAELLADAALGYQDCLDPIWQAGALRMVDIRADPHDREPETQLRRGYDERGHPLCIHGYPMRSNGHDYRRRRTKWRCAQRCLHDAERPAPDCPFRDDQYKHGQVVNVGHTLPDGSMRLARDVPYGSPAWKTRYGRRNLSESRNGCMESMGLKRLPCFGLTRGRKEIAIGDLLESLRTLGRLVQEATTLALKAAV